MSAVQPRFMHTNKLASSSVVLTASSSALGHPVAWVKNHMLAKVWRSSTAWVFRDGFNNRLDFTRGGTIFLATIVAGIYTTPAAVCTAVVNALEAADSTPVWACTYDSSTHRFTISTGAHSFQLLISSGANRHRAAWASLGYRTSAAPADSVKSTDTPPALAALAPFASYQSSHYIGIALPAQDSVTAVCVHGDNNALGTMYLRSSNASVLAAAALLDGDQLGGTTGGSRVAFRAGTAAQFYALVIEDSQNSSGFSEIGVLFLSAYGATTYGYEQENPVNVVTMSSYVKGASGAHFNIERAQADMVDYAWNALPDADMVVMRALKAAVPAGKAWFFCTDAGADDVSAATYYCFIRGDAAYNENPISPGLTDVAFGIEQILP